MNMFNISELVYLLWMDFYYFIWTILNSAMNVLGYSSPGTCMLAFFWYIYLGVFQVVVPICISASCAWEFFLLYIFTHYCWIFKNFSYLSYFLNNFMVLKFCVGLNLLGTHSVCLWLTDVLVITWGNVRNTAL